MHAIVGIASTHDGRGYWLVGADGGYSNSGDAGYFGSAAYSWLIFSNPITNSR